MDPISALTTHSNLQTLPISTPAPIPSSKSNTATQQQPTSTGDIQITTSVNQLRSFSTALSEFISRYDELHNNISFINSSIDSKLPIHLLDGTNPNCSVLLETSCDRTVQNPRERVSDCELRHSIATTPENAKTDALEKVEVVADVWKNHEEIEVCENLVEIDSLKKLEVADKHEEIDVCEYPVEIDSLNMQEETVPESSCDETIADVPETIVSEENPNKMTANGKQSNENVRTPECVEEIDVSLHKKTEENDICRNAEKTVLLKKLEEFDTLMIPDEIDSSKTRGEIVVLKKLEESVLETSHDQSIAIVSELKPNVMAMRTPESFEEVDGLKKLAVIDIPNKKVEVTDICNNSEQIDVLQQPEELDALMIPEEVGTLKKHEELDILMIPKEFDTPKKPKESLPETSCDQTITMVPEAIVTEQNLNQMVTDCEQSHENVSTPENLEEVDVFKKPEQTDILRKHEEIGNCKNPRETVVLEKPGKTETLKKRKENGTRKRAKKPKASKKSVVSNGEQRHEKVRTPEHIEENDILNESEQAYICKNPEESTVLKKPEELDIAVIPEEIDTLKNPEGSLPETSCDRTTTAVQEAIESEQNPNTMAANDKPSHEIVMTPECREETDVSIPKKPEQTVVSKKSEQTDILNKPEETVVSKKLKKINTLKKHEENGTCKKAKETEAHTTTTVPEAIVSEQNSNRIAANGKPNHENVMAPECLGETDVSVPKKPQQTVVSKKPEQTAVSKKPEQTAVSKKPEQTAVSKKLEQTAVSKKPEQTGILNMPQQTVVSKQLKNITTLKKHEENGTCNKVKETEAPKKFVISMLQSLCRGMCSKDMKWHVAIHYSEMINDREEIAKSLKLAKDPAKLVLYSIGRFFIQNSKTFCNSHQNKESLGRMASILILECFVMISSDDGIVIAKRDQQYAAEAAVDWKKRMIREGGLRHADEVDARGLLLLISGFGIEDHVFKNQDIIHLIRASNVKGIATALRCSAFLIPKISEVIYMMVNNDLEIEAVDIAYTFGLERTCHPGKILTTYLQNKIRDFKDAPPLQMLEAGKQHLFDLLSVKQCLESHNVDPSTLLPDFKINERIQNLERVVNKWKLNQKRKYLENPIHQEAKRPCVSHQNMPHQHRPVDHYGMNQSTQPSTSYITNHPASPVYNAYARPGNIKASVPNGLGGGFPGSYDQTMHMSNNQPRGWRGSYGQHHPTHGQTYGSQPDRRPWEQVQLESFPGFLGRQPPSSDLYGFAKLVEKGSRGSCA